MRECTAMTHPDTASSYRRTVMTLHPDATIVFNTRRDAAIIFITHPDATIIFIACPDAAS
jgi:hypothetical protein